MPMWRNNQAAINLLKSEKSSSSAKHDDSRFKFIYHYARSQIVQPSFVKSKDMIAGRLTKALLVPRSFDIAKSVQVEDHSG